MKAYSPYTNSWVEGKGEWVAFDHPTGRSVKSGFATKKSAIDWIHKEYPEYANGVTRNVTAEWFPSDLSE